MLLTRVAPSCARFSDTSLRFVSFQAADPGMEEAPSDASWCEARSRLPQKLLPELVQQSTRRLQNVERRFSHQRTIRTTGTSSRHSNLSTSYCRNDRVPTWTISPCSKTMNRLNSSFRRLVLRDLVKASGEPLLLLSKNDKLVVCRAEHPALPAGRQPRFGGL
jgi:hypothetical protein